MVNIRKPNIEDLDSDGIPRDFAQVRNYFNQGLINKSFKHIPRTTAITDEEIKTLWIPSLERNISLVAEEDGVIVGSITALYDVNSTNYEHRSQRVSGSVGSTINPDANYNKVLEALASGLIHELKTQRKEAIWTMAEETPANEILKQLGYKGELLQNQERYIEIGLSGKVRKYILP